MFGQICAAIGIAVVAAIGISIASSSKYGTETVERQALIRKLRGEGQDWKQIALTLNTGNYRKKDGEKFTENDVREEYARMTIDQDLE